MNTIICTLGKDNQLTIPQLIKEYNNWKNKKQSNIKVKWRTQSHTKVKYGDRVFFLKQGEINGNNLIFGSGVNISNTPTLRYDQEKNKHFYKIDVDIDYMIDPNDFSKGLKRKSGKFSKKLENETLRFWYREGSGNLLYDLKYIKQLQNKWKNHKPKSHISSPLIASSIITATTSIVKTKYTSEEDEYQEGINNATVPNVCPTPKTKKKGKTHSGYDRNASIGKFVINSKGYKCEMNSKHKTFIWKGNKRNQYMESHHLIPMKEQGNIKIPLDCKENIICLCPTCHRQFHSAIKPEKIKLIQIFFKSRALDLQKIGINTTLSSLKKYYNC